MNARHVLNWQQEALAHTLFKLEHKHLRWESLAPKLQLSSNAKGFFDPESGSFDTSRALSAPRPATTGVITVYVDALPELGIPAHTLSLIKGDYEAALNSLDLNEREAFFDFIGKPRYSALYTVKRVIRKRAPIDGEPQPPRVHHYLYAGDNAGKVLQSAFAKFIGFCERPSLERLENGNQTAIEATDDTGIRVEELAAVSGFAA